MKGRLFKKILPEGWYVAYNIDSFTKSELQLHPDDLDSEVVRWANNGSLSDKEVNFEIVKKFMADETLWYAKLTPYVSDDFQIGPDGAYEHTEEDERDWDVTLMDGLEEEVDIAPTSTTVNLEYVLDPTTKLIKLSFKQGILRELPIAQQYIFNNYILKLLAFNGKLTLTGSLALKLLGLEEMTAVGDFDFQLIQPLVEGEYRAMIESFHLTPAQIVFEGRTQDIEFSPRAPKWLLTKSGYIEGEETARYHLTAEIFNRVWPESVDILKVWWGDQELVLTHPSVIWGFRTILALRDHSQSRAKDKYWQKMIKLFTDQDYLEKTLKNLQQIQDMKQKISRYNSSITHNLQHYLAASEYIDTHSVDSPDYYDNLFKTVTPPSSVL